MAATRRTVLSVVVALLVAGALALDAQESSNPYRQLRYRFIGPDGNRAIAVAGEPGNPLVMYVGAASGGIFKTSDGGTTWQSIFDRDGVSSVGSLAIDPARHNVVWAGTGETFLIRPAHAMGNGIYRSDDAGRNWQRMGLEKTGRIGRVVIDPASSRHRVRLRARPRLRPPARARDLPHARRRKDVGSGAVRRREHRLRRPRHRPVQPADALRRYVAPADQHVGAEERRRERGRLHVARRRRHVAQALGPRSAGGRPPARQDGRRGRAGQPAPRIRARRGHDARLLPVRRRRRDVEAGQPAARAHRAVAVLHALRRVARRREPAVLRVGVVERLGRRRRDAAEGRDAGRRRQPRHLDRSDQRRPDHGRQRRGRERQPQ